MAKKDFHKDSKDLKDVNGGSLDIGGGWKWADNPLKWRNGRCAPGRDGGHPTPK